MSSATQTPPRSLVERWRLGFYRATPQSVLEPFAAWLFQRLQTLERILDRLHPAIEHPTACPTRVSSTTTTSITSTTVVDITDLTITITPTVDTEIVVYVVLSLECGALGAVGQGFTGSLYTNGVAEVGTLSWKPAAASTSSMATGVWQVSAKSGVEYVFVVKGVTSNVASTFTVLRFSSSLSVQEFPKPYMI